MSSIKQGHATLHIDEKMKSSIIIWQSITNKTEWLSDYLMFLSFVSTIILFADLSIRLDKQQ